MKYTQIPATAFQNIQLNAGILVDNFNPATGSIGNLIGATSGGVNFTDSVEYKDFGEDIDNCPKNTKELKQIDSREVKMSGTFVTVTSAIAKKLMGASDVDSNNANHIIPRDTLVSADFADMWWIGDYSDVNTGDNAGYVAIHVMNALSTGGFQIQSTDKDKGKFAFEFTGHYSMAAQDTVPYEVYVKPSSSVLQPSILLNTHTVTVEKDDTVTLTAEVVPAGTSVTWTSSADGKASVSNGVVTGEAEGTAIITASITVDGVTYTDTCTVIVTED